MFLRIVLLASVLLMPPAWAISNIASRNPGLPEQGLSGMLLMGLSGKTGNQQEQDYQGSAQLTWRKNDNVFLGIAERNYGKTREVKDTDDAFVHSRWTHLLTPAWGAEAFAQWEENEFSNLTSRVLLGGGFRYLLPGEKEAVSLSVGFGGFREREKLDLRTYQELNQTWRINSFYAYQHQLNPQVLVSSTAYFQPKVDDWEDIRVLFNLALTVKLTQTLDLQLAYKATHNSQPAQNLEAEPVIDNYKTNTEYSTSLVYSF